MSNPVQRELKRSEPGGAVSARTVAGRCAALAAGSLLLRLSLCLLLGEDLQPLFDEAAYLHRARSYLGILEHFAHGQPVTSGLADAAYGEGTWPPLHPLSLAFAMFLFESSTVVARTCVALASAMTTPVIYLLSLRVVSSRGALFAALIHLLYPSYIAFSHLLWSESTYMLFLLLSVLTTFEAIDARSRRLKLVFSTVAGGALGLAALTRAAALPYLVLIPAGLLYLDRRSRTRWLQVGLLVVVAAGVLAPWERALLEREGRLVPISAAGSFNLVLGNNPWPQEMGRDLRREIAAYARERNISRERAGRELAFEVIRRDPAAFAGRAAVKLRNLLAADEYVTRHLLLVRYPPLPEAAATVLLFVLFASLLLLIAATVGGLGRGRADRTVFLAVLALAGAVLPALTVSSTRMGLPLLALLLPFAGEGLKSWKRLTRGRWAVIGAVTLLAGTSAARMPQHNGLGPSASSHYRSLVAGLDRLLDVRTPIADCLRARSRADVEVRIERGYRFAGGRAREILLSPGRRPVRLDVVAETGDPGAPVLLSARRAGDSEWSTIEPIRREAGSSWQPTAVAGFAVRWCGGRP